MARSLKIPTVNDKLDDGKKAYAAAFAKAKKAEDRINVVIEEDEDFGGQKIGYSYVDFTGNMTLIS